MNFPNPAFRGRVRLVLLSVLSVSAVLRGDTPRFPTSEDLRHVKALAGPQLSPDGKQVLFTVTDGTADGGKAHLWVSAVAGGPARQLTFSPAADKRGEHNAVWAPDGSAIFFLAKRGEQTQLFRLPMAGGEAVACDLKVIPAVDDSKEKDAIPPAAPSEAGKADSKKDTKTEKDAKPDPIAINVSGFAPSPDGHWLAVWAQDPETPGEKKQKDAKADAVWVNHERHGQRLYLAALKADGTVDGALKPVSLAPDVQSASWSPLSDRLLVVTDPPNDLSDLGPASQAWLVSTAALDAPWALKAIPPTVRDDFAWRKDGAQIAFAAQSPDDAPPGFEELFALNLPQSGPQKDSLQNTAAPVRLMAGFAGGLAFTEPVFLSTGNLVAAVTQGTRMAAARFALDGKSAPELLSQRTAIVAGLATNRIQTGWVWTEEGSDQPPRLCFAPALGGDCQAVSIPDLTTAHFATVKSQVVSWQEEGLNIEGLLYLPPDTKGKKLPLVVDIHGGPLGSWADRHDEWIGFLMGHGWAVFRPNPRGSSSYGSKFAAANKNDLGGGDFRDIMTGVDEVLKNFPIDPAKLALIGYSYGGEMAGFAEVKTDRFKAIVSCAPVIDQFSEYGTERGSWYDRWYFGKPWDHFEDAWRQSPLSGASKAKTPFLLIQGEADVTDPLGQAQEMYRALRQAGVSVDLVTYPREDHGPLGRGIFGFPTGEPWHGFDARQRMIQFLQKGFGETQKD